MTDKQIPDSIRSLFRAWCSGLYIVAAENIDTLYRSGSIAGKACNAAFHMWIAMMYKRKEDIQKSQLWALTPCRYLILMATASLISSCSTNNSNNDLITNIDLSTPPLYTDVFASPNPSSDQVAFIRIKGTAEDSTLGFGLNLYDADSNTITCLVSDNIVSRPIWFDNSTILYSVDSALGPRLCLYDCALDTVTNISQQYLKNMSLSWSDSIIIFEHTGHVITYSIPSKTSTIISIGGYYEPNWSNLSDKIVVSIRALNGHAENLALLSRDGTYIQNITTPIDGINDSYPAWNNSGDRIVFERMRRTSKRTTYELVVYNFSNNKATMITSGFYPAYNYNDNIIYYSWITDSTVGLRIYSFNMMTENIEQITH